MNPLSNSSTPPKKRFHNISKACPECLFSASIIQAQPQRKVDYYSYKSKQKIKKMAITMKDTR